MKMFWILIIYAFAFQPGTYAQNPTYKNLVLEGGGIRGFAYAGAFELLDSLNILKGIERVGGTSAGAIQATLLAIGYTPREIIAIAGKVPLKQFNDGFLPGGFGRIKKQFGFYKGETLTQWIEKLIAEKTGNANTSFIELHKLRGDNLYKDLYITGTDLTHRCLRVFSYEHYPHMKIKDAVRISFSIPLYYRPVIIDNTGMVQTSNAGNNFSMMVDGGLLSNYPISLFDSTKYISDSTVINKYMINLATIGLLLEKPDLINKEQNNAQSITNLREYVTAVYKTIIDKPNPDQDSIRRTITISDLNLSGRVRKLSSATILNLMENGRAGVRDYFKAGILPAQMF